VPAGFRIADAYVEVDLDPDQLDDAIAEVEAKLQAIKDRAITLDIEIPPEEIAEVEALLDSLRGRADLTLNTAELMSEIIAIKDALESLQGDYNVLVDTKSANEALNGLMDSVATVKQGIVDTGDEVDTTAGKFRIWGTYMVLTGTQIHWIISGAAELLAVFAPAAVALGAGLADAAQGATWVYDRMSAVYTATEATSNVFHETAGQAIGLGDSLQQAQDKADPQVYEALGGVINGLKESFQNLFGTEGIAILQVFDKFVAQVDIDLRTMAPTLNSLVGAGVEDLTKIGQVFGNLGHALINLASDMPGLAEVLLTIIDDISKLIEWLTTMPGYIITVAMAIEEFMRWGGLLADGLGAIGLATADLGPKFLSVGRFVGVFMNLVLAMPMALSAAAMGLRDLVIALPVEGAAADAASGGLLTFASTMRDIAEGATFWEAAVGVVLVGGFVALSIAALHSQDAAEQFVGTMNNAIAKANFGQGFADAIGDLVTLQQKLQQASDASDTYATHFQQVGTESRLVGPSLSAAAGAAVTYQGEINKLTTQIVDASAMTTKFEGNTYTLYQTMGLANAAGLNLNNAFNAQGHLTALATQEINNLVVGYRAMDQTGTALYSDIQALNVQTLVQQTDVSKLNDAWDSYIQMLTGMTSSTGQFLDDMMSIGNVTTTASTKVQALSEGLGSGGAGLQLSVSGVASALQNMNGVGAQVWQNFDESITNARSVMDNLNTAAAVGALNQGQLTQGIKDVVAELLPYATDSEAAQSMLIALAQQGNNNITTFQGLKQWIGNTSDATGSLAKIAATATINMGNLNQVAANLSTTMNTVLDQAISNGAVNVKGITTATQNFTQSLVTTGATSNETKTTLGALATQFHDSGISATTAKGILGALASQEGETKSQSSQLADEIDNMIKQLNAIPKAEDTSINVQASGNWVIVGSPGTATAKAAAMGGIVPGYAPGKDSVLALLSPGEAVLVPELVHKLGPANILEWNRIAAAGRKTEVGMGGGRSVGRRYYMAGSAAGLHLHGLAEGGVIGSYHGSMSGVGPWAAGEFQGTVSAVEAATAAAALVGAPPAQAASGGIVTRNGITRSQLNTPTGWITAALEATGSPMGWLTVLGALVLKASGGNPNALSRSASGQLLEGLWGLQPSVFARYNAGGSIWDPVQEGMAALGYIKATWGSPYNIPGLVSGTYKGYGTGGFIPPGGTGIVGELGSPEYATALPGGGVQVTPGAGGAGRQIVVNQNFYGPQYPSPQQRAQMTLELNLALGTAP
jgi:hypothetical protein